MGDDNRTTVINSCLFVISVIGIIGNCITLYILSKSNIRKSNFYVLIMNQSIVDIVSCCATIVWICTYVWLQDNQELNGPLDWTLCVFVKSQFTIAALTCVSSYNLGVLALERMSSIVYPNFHRSYLSKRNQQIVSALVWAFGIGIILPHAILTNGINANGQCYYWDKFPSIGYSYVYEFSFNFFFNVVPMTMMVVAYSIIYSKVSRRGATKAVKYNVIKMLSTCVMLYFSCHAMRLVLSIATRFRLTNSYMGVMWMLAILLMQLNSIVNPIVYTFQYHEYRKELGKRVFRLIGVKIYKDTVENTSEASVSTERPEPVVTMAII